MGLIKNVQDALRGEQPLAIWREPSWIKLRTGDGLQTRLAAAFVVFLLAAGGMVAVVVIQSGGISVLAILACLLLALVPAFIALTWGDSSSRTVHLYTRRLAIAGTTPGIGATRFTVSDLPFPHIQQCRLVPYWSHNKPFSLLYVHWGQNELVLGVPKAVDLKRVTCVLAAGGVQVASPDPKVQMLAMQTAQAARNPGWQLAHAGISGTQNVGAPVARLPVLVGIVIGIPLLAVLALAVMYFAAQSKKRAQELAQQPPALRREMPAAIPRPLPARAEPVAGAAQRPIPAAAQRPAVAATSPANDEAVVIRGQSRTPAVSSTFDKVSGVDCLALNADGSVVYVGTSKGISRLSPGSNEATASYSEHKVHVTGIVMALAAPRAASFDGEELHVWSTDDLRPLARGTGGIAIQRVALSANGTLAAYSDVRGVKVLNVETHEVRSLTLPATSSLAAGLAFDADASHLLICGSKGVIVYNLTESTTAETIELKGFGVQTAALSSDGSILARVVPLKIEIWSLSERNMRATLPVKGTPGGLIVSPDGQRIYFGADKQVVACDAQGQELYRLEGHTLPVTHLALSADGKRLVTASSWNGSLRLWTLPN